MSGAAGATARLAGKVAVVTASTDGIGLAIARRLGQDGARVVISSRKEKNVERALTELKAENLDVMGTVCHVGKAEDRSRLVKETIDKFGRLDILVSNAAANPFFGNMLDCSEDQWDKIFDTNVKAAFLLCKDCVPVMEKGGGGSIIVVTSIGGYQPFPVLGPYSVSKTALLGLVKALAPGVAPLNIRVNGIAPGVIRTRFSEALWKDEAAEAQAVAGIPWGRLGEPEDVGGLASYLASDDSRYVTGETVVIAGGMTSRL